MLELDRPRIAVDFNEMIENDVVLLSKEDSVRDSSGKLIDLRAGMRVDIYMRDADERGVPRNLLASGVVELNDANDWSSSVRWRCRIDKWESEGGP